MILLGHSSNNEIRRRSSRNPASPQNPDRKDLASTVNSTTGIGFSQVPGNGFLGKRVPEQEWCLGRVLYMMHGPQIHPSPSPPPPLPPILFSHKNKIRFFSFSLSYSFNI
jgi:hypothetical protein